ncbi:MAG: COP9 signalosome (CSN) subunit, partial [Pleopsidium flavum]
PYPRLRALFTPLGRYIKSGDLAGFDAALAAGENEFVKRRIYLTLERGRDITLRNLLRKVFLAGGFEAAKEEGAAPVRRTRIPVAEFGAAIRLGSKTEEGRLENDEVECLLANMIYKAHFAYPRTIPPSSRTVLTYLREETEADDQEQNLMKGYIARERAIVVLSKGGTAFPGTGV